MLLEWKKELDNFTEKEIDAVNDRISSVSEWQANDKGRQKIKKWVKEFSVQLVLDAVDIAFEQYYDGSEESWQFAFNKIGGICFNKTRSDKNEVFYLNVLKKSCFNEFNYVNPSILSTIVHDYIQDDDDFNLVTSLIKRSYSWSDFINRVRGEFGYE